MSEKRYYKFLDDKQEWVIRDRTNRRNEFRVGRNKGYAEKIVDLLNEQQYTIEKQKRIIKSQDAEISRQYNLCLAMSGVLREEFGVYDVFDRTKDKKI